MHHPRCGLRGGVADRRREATEVVERHYLRSRGQNKSFVAWSPAGCYSHRRKLVINGLHYYYFFFFLKKRVPARPARERRRRAGGSGMAAIRFLGCCPQLAAYSPVPSLHPQAFSDERGSRLTLANRRVCSATSQGHGERQVEPGRARFVCECHGTMAKAVEQDRGLGEDTHGSAN